MPATSTPLDPAWVAAMLQVLVKAIPGEAASAQENLAFARILFEALEPSDAAEAALAVRAIAAHVAAMDSFARAAKPGLSDETVVRLRTNALAAGRVYDGACRTLRRHHAASPTRAGSGRAISSETRVRHRVEPPFAIPGVADLVPNRTAGWRSATALTPVQPTVPVPG